MHSSAKKLGGVSLAAAFVALLALLVAFCVAAPQQAQAVSYKVGKGVHELSWDSSFYESGSPSVETYKKADVTGDKKKDKVQLVAKKTGKIGYRYGIASMQIKVNGKVVKTYKGNKGYSLNYVDIITLKNKKSYLWISEYSDSKERDALYQVKKGKLKKIASVNSFLKAKNTKYEGCGPVKVKGNTIYCHAGLTTKALGWMETKNTSSGYMKLAYSKGKFKLKSSSMAVEEPKCGEIWDETADDEVRINYYTAKKTINAKKSISSSKTAVTIKKGQTFTVTKMTVAKKSLYTKVKTSNGKTGWVKLGKNAIVQHKSDEYW